MTDKSDDKVGHLNTILARGGGNLNDSIFKSSNARGLPGVGGGGGGMLKFQVDRRIRRLVMKSLKNDGGESDLQVSQGQFTTLNLPLFKTNYLGAIGLV